LLQWGAAKSIIMPRRRLSQAAASRQTPMLDKPADGPVRHDDTRRPALGFQAHIAELEARGLLVRMWALNDVERGQV